MVYENKFLMIMDNDILVSISCITYNHEPYIRQCLDGFVMQKTNFKFEVLIHDDASTDGTANIIREYLDKYPNLIKPIFQAENQYSKGIAISQTYNCPRAKGKYIALCEGDDYWTDPYKLQKQVDFLEANPEYSMCFANAIEHWEDGSKDDKCFSNIEDRDYTGVEIYENWIVPTASVLYRKEIVFSERYKEIRSNKNFIFGDIVLFLTCAEFGKLRGMSDVVSVYRRHEGGITNQVNKIVDNRLKIIHQQKVIADVFGKTINGVKHVSNKKTCNALVVFFIFECVYSRKLYFSLIKESFALSFYLTLFYFFVRLGGVFIRKVKKIIQKIES